MISNGHRYRPESRLILGTRIDATSYLHATESILDLARNKRGGYVCVANVHMVMEGYDSTAFQEVVNRAALVTPDGMPLVWMIRALGIPEQKRVYGPNLMLEVCAAAARAGVSVGLLGATSRVLNLLEKYLERRVAQLEIVYSCAPPFGPLSAAANSRIIEDVNRSGAEILFVGLGCPKQESWMAENSSASSAVMLGVGAAFDFHAQTLKQAPRAMQDLGLEWLFRLAAEPRRLWRRYLFHNPRFVALALNQLREERFL